MHRIGRTARAGASGVAWSLVDPSEKSRIRAIERLIDLKLTWFDTALVKIDLDETAGKTQGKPSGSSKDRGVKANVGRRRRRRRSRNQKQQVSLAYMDLPSVRQGSYMTFYNT